MGGDGRKFDGVIEMFYVLMEIVVKQVYLFVNMQQIVHFIACKLYLIQVFFAE